MKTCRKCGVCKSVDAFNKSTKGCALGLHSYCRDCQKVASAESYQRNKARKKAEYEAWKATDPEAVKAFHRARSERYGKQRKARAKVRYAENRETVKAKQREYSRQPEVRTIRIVYNRAWYAKNRDEQLAKKREQYAANPELHVARMRASHQRNYPQWAEKNRPKLRAMRTRRRAAELQATPSWADDTLIREFYATADALNMWTGEWHHVDHIVPLQGKTVCGLHTQANLQILPAIENFSKNNKRWPDQP